MIFYITIISHIPSCLRGKNLSLNSSTLVSTKLKRTTEAINPNNAPEEKDEISETMKLIIHPYQSPRSELQGIVFCNLELFVGF